MVLVFSGHKCSRCSYKFLCVFLRGIWTFVSIYPKMLRVIQTTNDLMVVLEEMSEAHIHLTVPAHIFSRAVLRRNDGPGDIIIFGASLLEWLQIPILKLKRFRSLVFQTFINLLNLSVSVCLQGVGAFKHQPNDHPEPRHRVWANADAPGAGHWQHGGEHGVPKPSSGAHPQRVRSHLRTKRPLLIFLVGGGFRRPSRKKTKNSSSGAACHLCLFKDNNGGSTGAANPDIVKPILAAIPVFDCRRVAQPWWRKGQLPVAFTWHFRFLKLLKSHKGEPSPVSCVKLENQSVIYHERTDESQHSTEKTLSRTISLWKDMHKDGQIPAARDSVDRKICKLLFLFMSLGK